MVSCGVVCRRGLDLALLWLWCRPAATSSDLTPSLGTSICRGCGPKRTKDKKKKEKEKEKEIVSGVSFI